MNNLVSALLVGTISAAKYTSQDGGPTWSITYDSSAQKYNFNADV